MFLNAGITQGSTALEIYLAPLPLPLYLTPTLQLYLQSIPKAILMRKLTRPTLRVERGVQWGERVHCISKHTPPNSFHLVYSIHFWNVLSSLSHTIPLYFISLLALHPLPSLCLTVSEVCKVIFGRHFPVPGEAVNWRICIHPGTIESNGWENLTFLKRWGQRKIVKCTVGDSEAHWEQEMQTCFYTVE